MAKKDITETHTGLWFREELIRQTEALTGVDKVLVDNLIEKLCSVNDLTDELLQIVRDTGGPMIEKEVGSVNNRHLETVENPAMTSFSKSVKVLADISMKVGRVAKGASADNGEEEDDAMSWGNDN